MSLCCIGGVCIPYSALVPLLVYALKWVLQKLSDWGLLPAVIHDRLKGLVPCPTKKPGDSSCCQTTAPANDEEDELVHTIRNKQQWNALLDANATVVCKFTADWCSPCKRLAPVYKSLAHAKTVTSKNTTALFCHMDVDEMDGLASDHGIALLPTFVVFHQGKEVGRYAGSNEARLCDLLDNHLN